MLFAQQLRETHPAPSPTHPAPSPRQGQCQQLALLRSTYLDREAIEAGAEGTEMYLDEQLVRREACRQGSAVKAALAAAWTACTQGEAVITKPLFLSMARRIYLALLLDPETGGEHRISAVDCMKSAEMDWERDTSGKEYGIGD